MSFRLGRPELTFALPCLLVITISLLHGRRGGDFGDGDIPPRVVPGHAIVVVRFDDDYRGCFLFTETTDCAPEFVMASGAHGRGAKLAALATKSTGICFPLLR